MCIRDSYHLLLFNCDIKTIQKAWSASKHVYIVTKCKRSRHHGVTHRARKKEVWNHMGNVHYGDKRGVSGASVGYCLKYILKSKGIERNPLDDSEKEFAVMSKGLGKDYVTPAMVRWHKHDLLNLSLI